MQKQIPQEQTLEVEAQSLLQFRNLLLQHGLEAEGLEGDTFADEVLAHGLDPMQTQRVQHSAGALHDDEHGDREHEPDSEEEEDGDDADTALHRERIRQRHGPQHDRELLVGE